MNEGFDLAGLACAIGVGLLIGVERERRKGQVGRHGAPGLRTFTLAGLLGALATLPGGPLTLAAVALAFGALSVTAYLRSAAEERDFTTEVALLVTFLLGVLAMQDAALASGIGVVVAVVLTERERLHRFVNQVITEAELHDALLLAASALVVLPLMPDRTVGPWSVLNPRTLWTLAVLMMAINAAGYVALRAMGPGVGLPLAGLASGFVSSSATVAAMGARAKSAPALLPGAVSGSVLSSVSTVVQLAMVLAATSVATLVEAAAPLLACGVVAVGYAAFFARRRVLAEGGSAMAPGRAFDPRLAVGFAAMMGAVAIVVAGVRETAGAIGVHAAVALAGFADVHSPVAAVGSLVATGAMEAPDAVFTVLLAFTANSATKAVLAFASGAPGYAKRVVPGVALMVVAAWLAWLLEASMRS